MSVAVAIRRMVEMGLTYDQALIAVEAFEFAGMGAPEPKSAGAIRQRRYRERHKASQSVTEVTPVTESVTRYAPTPDKEIPQTPKEINPTQEHKPEPDGSVKAHIAEAEIAAALEAYSSAARVAGWPQVRLLTKPRRAALRRCLDEAGGPAGFAEAMRRASQSSFLCGGNKEGWKADIDFLTKASKFNKLLEGGYDDRKPTGEVSGSHGYRSGADQIIAAGRRRLAQLEEAGGGFAAWGSNHASGEAELDLGGGQNGSHDVRSSAPGDDQDADIAALYLPPPRRLGHGG